MKVENKPRKIIHVDMDCFFAAVEIKDNPYLKGLPLAVGGTKARGVLTTASYEARVFGVRSAMPTHRALKLCQDLVVIPPRIERYQQESQHIHRIFQRFTPQIQKISLDEAYLDVTESSQWRGSATWMARELKRIIKQETGLTASAGVAPNKFLAKVASDWKKPNGLTVITPEQVNDFVEDLPVGRISGVGRVMTKKLHSLGVYTCGDLQKVSLSLLIKRFGAWGASLYKYSRGVDHRPVEPLRKRKSLSVERTFFDDKKSLEDLMKTLPEIYEEFKKRLDKSQLQVRVNGHFVKIKFYNFKTTTHELKSDQAPSLEQFKHLIKRGFQRQALAVRLLGLGVRFKSEQELALEQSQLSLF